MKRIKKKVGIGMVAALALSTGAVFTSAPQASAAWFCWTGGGTSGNGDGCAYVPGIQCHELGMSTSGDYKDSAGTYWCMNG